MKIQSSFPFFDDESIDKILPDIKKALSSGVLTGGPYTKEFESKFAQYVGAKHAVAVNSGTSNLEIAMRYFGVKDREVIVPTNTFVATPNAVVFAGGKPVFADIREDTLCIDPQDVEHRITPKTVGLIVVHLAGLICPQIEELVKVCKDHDLFLLEDCSHAHGAMIDNRMAGTLGDAGCFSFYSTKVMTTGEGGMLTTQDADLAEAARMMRDHGQNSQRLMVRLGHNWCMSEIAAILGLHQLEQLEFFVHRRNEIAKLYDSLLKDVKGVSLFKTPPNIRHSYYKYPVKLDAGIDKEKIAATLKAKYGVETGSIYYPPCHLHPFYMENFGARKGDLPRAESVLKQVMCLPLHAGLSNEAARYVAEAFAYSLNGQGV
ncbi:MAG: DegT/DnrJ/EryC1/StrS family aminotransferase [Candidatus Bathyarchaeota archaeon]|nr:DegT/DnrJ/EryC1/StrS family aminotransferase [Candidatus Bathyarchaeota archaeon]